MIENIGSAGEEFRLDRYRIPCKCKTPHGSPSGHTFIKYLSFFIHAVKKYKDEVLIALPLEGVAVFPDCMVGLHVFEHRLSPIVYNFCTCGSLMRGAHLLKKFGMFVAFNSSMRILRNEMKMENFSRSWQKKRGKSDDIQNIQ